MLCPESETDRCRWLSCADSQPAESPTEPIVSPAETESPTFTVGIYSRFAYVQRKPSARSVTTVVP